MNTYYVEQRAEVWVRTTVQADTAKAALELGKKQILDGHFSDNSEAWEFQNSETNPHLDLRIWGGADGVAVSLNKDGSVTELRYKD
jgi:hypothetical protein